VSVGNKSRGGRARAMYDRERLIILDAARGLTAEQSAELRGTTKFSVYDTQRKVKIMLGASTIAHAVALTIAYGYITHDEITGKD
jgi:DNA-binding CsgD family transcriptional regulator